MSAIPIPSLWIPRRKKLWLPTPTWAMGHLRKTSHHLIKHTPHLVKADCGDRFIQAKLCADDSDVDYWFRLLPGDDTIITFTTPTGSEVHLAFYFKVDSDCYYVNATCNISTSPGTVVTDRDTLDYHGSCVCEPDNPIYYPVYQCCTGEFLGYILISDFETWQSDNSTEYVVGGDGSNYCWRVDTSQWFFNAPSPYVAFDGLTPYSDCGVVECCCCKPLSCCPNFGDTTCTLTYDFNITDDGCVCEGDHSGSTVGIVSGAGGYTWETSADEVPPAPHGDITVVCTDGEIFVTHIGIQDPGGGGCFAGWDGHIAVSGGAASGSFDSVFGCPGETHGSGSWSILIDFSDCE